MGVGSETHDARALARASRTRSLRRIDFTDLAYRYAIVLAWIAVIVHAGAQAGSGQHRPANDRCQGAGRLSSV